MPLLRAVKKLSVLGALLTPMLFEQPTVPNFAPISREVDNHLSSLKKKAIFRKIHRGRV
jgi:hypothetical protein